MCAADWRCGRHGSIGQPADGREARVEGRCHCHVSGRGRQVGRAVIQGTESLCKAAFSSFYAAMAKLWRESDNGERSLDRALREWLGAPVCEVGGAPSVDAPTALPGSRHDRRTTTRRLHFTFRAAAGVSVTETLMRPWRQVAAVHPIGATLSGAKRPDCASGLGRCNCGPAPREFHIAFPH
jgi:hypothetical protein